MIDLGDKIPGLVFKTVDENGGPANAGSVTLTITLPDLTTAEPDVDNPAVGTYEATYLTVQAGLHRIRWVATGANAKAYADAANVIDGAWTAFVGLTEVKEHINYEESDTADDEELRGFVLSSSAVVEDIVGAVARRQVTETYSGGDRAILLRRRPVVDVVSVVIDGATVDAGDYTASPAGVLHKKVGCWPRGFHNIEVAYNVGRSVVQPNVIDATKELVKINWRPQQGGNYSAFDGARGDDFGQGSEAGLQGHIRLGFFVPNTVMQRLQPNARGPNIA